MKNFFKNFAFLLIVITLSCWIINQYIIVKTQKRILSLADNIPIVEAVVVPGASVYRSGKLSPALSQRMDAGIMVKKKYPSIPLILSGHSIPNGYNETLAMIEYAREKGIPATNILADERGRSTYVTLLNCRQKFHLQKILIVSQSFYLPRTLYIAESLGLDAYGLVVEDSAHSDVFHPREFISRIKDFFFLKLTRLFRAA